jgi:uncharacterized protein YegL
MHAELFYNGTGQGCLQLLAQEQDAQTAPQLVVVALDCSGSMAGPKLAAAKKAVQFCLAHLRSNVDRFALVTFDQTARLLLPPATVTDTNRAALQATAETIRPGGSTNLAGALVLALAQVPEAGTAQVILATDGLPNVGLCESAALQALLCDHSRGKTIRMDTAGFGADHNDELLCSLATQGVYTFLEHADGICDWAATRLGHLLSVVVSHVDIALQGVENIRVADGMAVTGGTVHLPQLAAEASKHVLFQLADPRAVSGSVAYHTPDGALHRLALAAPTLRPALVAEQHQRWQFVDAVQKARQLAEAQQLAEARAVLEQALAAAVDAAHRERLQELLALYTDSPTYRSLGRQRSTEAARCYAMEEESGGRALETAFTTSAQRSMRAAAAAPAAPAAPTWQWENDPVGAATYVDFEPSVQQLLHAARAAGQRQIQTQIHGSSYTLHLEAQVQVNDKTQFVRQIRVVS